MDTEVNFMNLTFSYCKGPWHISVNKDNISPKFEDVCLLFMIHFIPELCEA